MATATSQDYSNYHQRNHPARNANHAHSQSNTDLIRRYEALLFSPEISLVSINQAILRSAATLRAQTNLKTPDAIHAATALNKGCTVFLTNDAALRKVPGLSTVVLKDVLDV